MTSADENLDYITNLIEVMKTSDDCLIFSPYSKQQLIEKEVIQVRLKALPSGTLFMDTKIYELYKKVFIVKNHDQYLKKVEEELMRLSFRKVTTGGGVFIFKLKEESKEEIKQEINEEIKH